MTETVTIYTPTIVYRHPGMTNVIPLHNGTHRECRECAIIRHPAGKAVK